MQTHLDVSSTYYEIQNAMVLLFLDVSVASSSNIMVKQATDY